MERPYIKGLVLFAILMAMVSAAFAGDPAGAEEVAKAAAAAAAKAKAAAFPFKAIAVGMTCSCVALGVALVGFAAANSVGRNPGASGEILKIGIIAMAFVEAIAFYVLFLLNG